MIKLLEVLQENEVVVELAEGGAQVRAVAPCRAQIPCPSVVEEEGQDIHLKKVEECCK